MAETHIFANLNYECLEHLFSFLTPKEWVQFAQMSETCKAIATSCKDLHKFTFMESNRGQEATFIKPNERSLDVAEFWEIFKLVAPELKCLKLKKNKGLKPKVLVSFGRFKYAMVLNKSEEEKLMHTFFSQTKNVEKLEINSFGSGTVLKWKQFFQANPVECFQFLYPSRPDTEAFFKDFISILPKDLTEIEFWFGFSNWLSNDEEQRLVQLLKRLTKLSKVFFLQHERFSVMIAAELLNHANLLQDLTIKQVLLKEFDDIPESIPEDNEEDLEILDVIAKLSNLQKLCLKGFYLQKDRCRSIVEHCQSIHCLELVGSNVPEESLEILMTLPALTKLHINPETMTFSSEVTELKQLIINNRDEAIDDESLIRTLTLMPNLSWLSFQTEEAVSEEAARAIKQIIHSRRQKIVLYSMRDYHRSQIIELKKVSEILCPFFTKNEFQICCEGTYSPDASILQKKFKKA